MEDYGSTILPLSVPSLSSWPTSAVVLALGIGVWVIVEVAFYINFIAARRRLQDSRGVRPAQSRLQRREMYRNCLHTVDNVKTWCVGWFFYAHNGTHPSFGAIRRDNFASWLAWAFWQDHLDNVRRHPRWANELEWMVRQTEQWFHITFPKGYNPDLQCIRLQLDPVLAVHRPLIVYLVVYAITLFINSLLMYAWGCEQGGTRLPGTSWGGILDTIDQCLISRRPTPKNHHVTYWYRPGQGGTGQTPIVFVHGIGIGITCYLHFIKQLFASNRPVFCVELPYVSMRMVEQVPSVAETVHELDLMLRSHGFSRAVFVAHSLGTAVTSWVMTRKPKLVAGVVFIDPICFLLHHHHVAFNFVHRKPRNKFEYVLHYGASRELYISHYISRHFDWFQTIYFVAPPPSGKPVTGPQRLPLNSPMNNSVVFLSRQDGIIDSPCVEKYLHDCGVDTYMMRGMQHAGFLFSSKWRNKIAHQVQVIAGRIDDEGFETEVSLS